MSAQEDGETNYWPGYVDALTTMTMVLTFVMMILAIGVYLLSESLSKSLLATLLLSAGTPMILSGDESGRTQQGNNNVYCQDNELSWTDWGALDQDLIEWTKLLLQIRDRYSVLRPQVHPSPEDLHWFNEDGTVLTSEQWNDPDVRVVQELLGFDAVATTQIYTQVTAGALREVWAGAHPRAR